MYSYTRWPQHHDGRLVASAHTVFSKRRQFAGSFQIKRQASNKAVLLYLKPGACFISGQAAVLFEAWCFIWGQAAVLFEGNLLFYLEPGTLFYLKPGWFLAADDFSDQIFSDRGHIRGGKSTRPPNKRYVNATLLWLPTNNLLCKSPPYMENARP